MNTDDIIENKIFVLSRQRCGTTSTGDFLENLGVKTCRESPLTSQLWSMYHLTGQFDQIFSHPKFAGNQGFEDNPWWRKDMFKQLMGFPNAKFILLHRNPDDWFDSMRAFNNGFIFELPILHMAEYERTEEYFDYYTLNKIVSHNHHFFKIEEHHRRSYTELYERRHNEIIQFFKKEQRTADLFLGELGSKFVWEEMANFLGFHSEPLIQPHSNKRGTPFQPQPSMQKKIKAILSFAMSSFFLGKSEIRGRWRRNGESYVFDENYESEVLKR